MIKPINECRLYTFVDLTYLGGRSPIEIASQLCDGGSDLIQLRAKNSSEDEIRRLTEQLLPLTERAGIGLVINDHLQAALDTGAPYCHLGQEDFFERGFTHVSQVIPQNSACQIGLSSHAPAQGKRALTAGAVYLGIGPVYFTSTKPEAAPASLDYVRWASAHVQIPWFAIGGITLENVDEVLAAGARGICVISAILTAPDIGQACRQFLNRLDQN